MSDPLSQRLYNLKHDCYRRLRQSPEGKISVVFTDNEKELKIDDPQELPNGDILRDFFENSSKVQGILYFNEKPVKRILYLLGQEEEEEEEIQPQKEHPETSALEKVMENQQKFFTQFMQQQEFLSEMKLKSHQEITQLKLDGMKQQFEQMLEAKESIFQERMELAKKEMELDSGLEAESLLSETIRDVVESVKPLLSDFLKIYIDKNTRQPINVIPKKRI
jgi:hypothetical protein